jgi:hypothetical protein
VKFFIVNVLLLILGTIVLYLIVSGILDSF